MEHDPFFKVVLQERKRARKFACNLALSWIIQWKKFEQTRPLIFKVRNKSMMIKSSFFSSPSFQFPCCFFVKVSYHSTRRKKKKKKKSSNIPYINEFNKNLNFRIIVNGTLIYIYTY